jgi:hypothetical protein
LELYSCLVFNGKNCFCILFCAVCFSAQDPFLFSAPVVDLRPNFILLCLVPPVHACPIFSLQRIRELRVRLGLPALISRFGSCFSYRSFASRIWSCRHLGHCCCRPRSRSSLLQVLSSEATMSSLFFAPSIWFFSAAALFGSCSMFG